MATDATWEQEPIPWRRAPVRHLRDGLLGLALVVAYGIAGYLWMGWSLSDASYMVAITISTVGFTEVRPLTTPGVRLHTMIVIGLGTITVAYLVCALLSLFTEGELQRPPRCRRRTQDRRHGHLRQARLGPRQVPAVGRRGLPAGRQHRRARSSRADRPVPRDVRSPPIVRPGNMSPDHDLPADPETTSRGRERVRRGPAPTRSIDRRRLSAWRTGSCGGPSCGRTSSARPCGRPG